MFEKFLLKWSKPYGKESHLDLPLASYMFGYMAGVAGLLQGIRGPGTIQSERVYSDNVLNGVASIAGAMIFSQRALRLMAMIQCHDCRDVPGYKQFLDFRDTKTVFLSTGSVVGSFFACSALISVLGKNPVYGAGSELASTLLSNCRIDKASLKNLSFDTIMEKSGLPELRKETLCFDLEIMQKIHWPEYLDQDFEMFLKTYDFSFLNSQCKERSDSGPKPYSIGLRLAKPETELFSPEDPIESERFQAVIERNPGYGLPFWEFVTCLAKSYGAYLVPTFSIKPEANLYPEGARAMIEALKDLSVE